MQLRGSEVATHLGGALDGPDVLLSGLADLREAGPTELSFLSNPRYARHLAASRAGAVLLAPGVDRGGRAAIRVDDPYLAFARAMELFHPLRWPEGGVHPAAVVHPSAHLAEGVCVEPNAVIGEGAVVEEGSWIQAGAYVGPGARIGPRCRLMPTSVVMDRCVLGAGVWLNPGAIIGSEGFGFAPGPTGLVKIPQPGPVVIEDDVEVGANSCVDRPALGETRVGKGAKLDNFVQVGHAARVGPHDVMVAFSGVAGSARLGKGVTLAARSSVLGHLEIGDGVTVAAHSMVAQDAPAGARLAGVPAIEHRRWLKASAALAQLPELLAEVRALRKRVEVLESQRKDGDA